MKSYNEIQPGGCCQLKTESGAMFPVKLLAINSANNLPLPEYYELKRGYIFRLQTDGWTNFTCRIVDIKPDLLQAVLRDRVDAFGLVRGDRIALYR